MILLICRKLYLEDVRRLIQPKCLLNRTVFEVVENCPKQSKYDCLPEFLHPLSMFPHCSEENCETSNLDVRVLSNRCSCSDLTGEVDHEQQDIPVLKQSLSDSSATKTSFERPDLIFESCFESGNLRKVIQVNFSLRSGCSINCW